jgi:hypothetical protein
MQLFSVVFYVVTAMHKFHLRLFTYETTNTLWPVKRRSCSDRDAYFWQNLYVFAPSSFRALRTLSHALQINYVLLSKGQYLSPADRLRTTAESRIDSRRRRTLLSVKTPGSSVFPVQLVPGLYLRDKVLETDNKPPSYFQCRMLRMTGAAFPPTRTSFLTWLIKRMASSPLWTGLSHEENMLQSSPGLCVQIIRELMAEQEHRSGIFIHGHQGLTEICATALRTSAPAPYCTQNWVLFNFSTNKLILHCLLLMFDTLNLLKPSGNFTYLQV